MEFCRRRNGFMEECVSRALHINGISDGPMNTREVWHEI